MPFLRSISRLDNPSWNCWELWQVSNLQLALRLRMLQLYLWHRGEISSSSCLESYFNSLADG